MISRIREQIGTAGLVVAIIALIAALGGAAFAASGGLSGKQKKEVKAIAKSFQGTGPAGAAGKDGAPGAAGKDGAQGPEGKQGPQGVQGVPGTPGKDGKEGSPWTAGGILPSEKTETGVWGGGGSGGLVAIPISFTLPVEPPPTLVFVAPEETKVAEGCPGIAAGGLPLADPGKLCVYAGFSLNAVLFSNLTIEEEFGIKSTPPGVGPAGTIVNFACGSEELPLCRMNGAWAVTAE